MLCYTLYEKEIEKGNSMQLQDHINLANILWKYFDIKASKGCKLAFILGSIEPDINFITYFRGSMKHEKMRGHNYDNVISHMGKLISKIQMSTKQVLKYYKLGKLIHYVADSFTFPHNKEFTGNLEEHCRYEDVLHLYMNKYLLGEYKGLDKNKNENLLNKIKILHNKYVGSIRNYYEDCYYIVNVSIMVMKDLIKELENEEFINISKVA